MKKFFLSFFVMLFLASVSFVGLWYYYSDFKNADMVNSPLPEFLKVNENKQVTLLDFWLPFFERFEADASTVENNARSALIFDLTTEKMLYEKNAKDRMPMASLTKVMTAIIALENPKPDDKYLVYPEDTVGEDSMGLTAGETASLEELLYGLLLPSGNDAAEVLAHNYVEGRQAFLQAMNDKAKALGLSDTNFSNPSGLQGDGMQYTTAYDMLVITRYALEHFPLFKEIVSTIEYEIPATDFHKYFYLSNSTNLLTSYPGVKGVKTGFTPEAGMCLITYLEYEDHKIIGILLNSPNRRQEMKDLLDYSLKSLNITPPPHE